jgi:N-acetylglutamate synthase and related acetyltransferases
MLKSKNDMEIKPVEVSDVSALSHLQPAGWVNIMPVFDFYVNSSSCFPIKVMMDNKIVGLGTTIIHSDVAWLGHIIVDSDYRCRGIGSRITRTLIEISEKYRCSTIYLIATELGEFIYKKIGFVTETEYLVHTDVRKKDWVISDHIYPYEHRYREEIRKLDKQISGEDRMIHLEEHFKSGRIYYSNNRLEGYYMPTWGEGLIIASTEKGGIELLKAHLKNKERVVIPQNNHIARRFLQETGVGEVKAIKRMRLGSERQVHFFNIYNRIGGNLG